jgi:hypothetical protein
VPGGQTLIGLDEDSAMVGDGSSWQVLGRGGIHVYRDGGWEHHAADSRLDLAFDLAR